jgi:hypothetical protein
LHKGKEDYFRQKDYLHDVEICQQFVKRNRAEMGTQGLNLGKVCRNGNTLQSHIKPQSDRYNTHNCGG